MRGVERFAAEDVERGMGDVAAVESGEHRVVIDEGPAARVDDHGTFRKHGDSRRVERVFRLGRCGQEEHEYLGLSKHL